MQLKRVKLSAPVQIGLLAVLAIAVVILRRPDQLLQPAVWAEDGMGLIPLAEHGIGSLLSPVGGYYIILPKLILYGSARISLLYLPALSYALAVLVTVAVVLAVALSPTVLEWRWLCALSVLFVPTNPEVFSVGLYTFWWANLLVILVVLWLPGHRNFLTRAGFLVVGGSSAPLVVGLLPLFFWRAFAFRRWEERALAALAVALSVFQLSSIVRSHVESYLFQQPGRVLYYGIRDMLGWYPTLFIHGGDRAKFNVGVVLGVILVLLAVRYVKRRQYAFIALLAVFAICAVLSVSRVPAWIIHPADRGPRYFFYPFVLLSWIWIWVVAREERWWRWIAVALLVLAAFQSLRAFTRHHEPYHWRREVARCATEPRHGLDVETDGRDFTQWFVPITPELCRKLVASSALGWWAIQHDSGSRGWSLARFDPGPLAKPVAGSSNFTSALFPELASPLSPVPVSIRGAWTVDGYYSGVPGPPLPGTAYGSWSGSDANTGSIRLGPFSADGSPAIGIPVITGPRTDGLSLRLIDASTSDTIVDLETLPSFPSQFWVVWKVPLPPAVREHPLVIEAKDAGRAWGQWLAVAIPHRMKQEDGSPEK